jgi:hypothetical protein
MVEENGENYTNVDDATVVLGLPILNGQPAYPEADNLLDEGRSSSLSDIDDGGDELDMASATSALSRQIEADSEAETERLENSPNKNQKHTVNTAPYTKIPSKVAQSTVSQVVEQDPFSDSVVSSPGPSDEDLESDLHSDHSAVYNHEHNGESQIRGGSPKKRKHLAIENGSGSEEDPNEPRRQRRRTESVRSDLEEHSDLGLSREATIEPVGDVLDGQNRLAGTSGVLPDAENLVKPQGVKEARRKHSRIRGHETLKNIVEEGEDPNKVAEPGGVQPHPESDDEERVQGEDEDVEAAARDEEECTTTNLKTFRRADSLQMQRRWQLWTPWPPWRSTSLHCGIGACL